MQTIGNDYKEQLEDGKLLLFLRNAIFQARIYIGDGKYLHRSLKTSNKTEARKRALRLLHETEYKQQAGLPLKQMTMAQLIDEYVALRQRQYEQCEHNEKKAVKGSDYTSAAMLRQIKRVVKFWREYCGNAALDKIDNGVLQGFIAWRKDYYHRMPKDCIPQNAKLNPADSTLQWEMTLGKTLIKYAHERGYRGAMLVLPRKAVTILFFNNIFTQILLCTSNAQLFRGSFVKHIFVQLDVYIDNVNRAAQNVGQ